MVYTNVPILKLDTTNANGIVYPTAAVQQWLDTNGEAHVFGKIGMTIEDAQQIDLDKVSHLVKDLRIEGNQLVGTVQVLDTMYGNLLRQLPEQEYAIACTAELNENREVTSMSIRCINAIAPGTKA